MHHDISHALAAAHLEDTGEPSANNTASDKMILPADVMSIVLDYCNPATCLAVLYTCRSYHSLAIPHVYKEIALSTPKQLRSFIDLSEKAAYDDHIARRFSYTTSFYYRLKQGSSAVSSSKAKQEKLYTTLRNLASHTSDGKVLFPNLHTASFEQVPQIVQDYPYKPTFLSDVKIVHLEHSALSLYDLPPNFTALGMRDVREVHMYHLAGCEVSHKGALDTYLNYQASLEKLCFHLSGHFENTVCTDQNEHRTHTLVHGEYSILEPVRRSRRSFDTAIYIKEYADAVAMISASVAYAQITAASRPHSLYPSLKKIIVDVGCDRKRSLPTEQVPTEPPEDNAEECTDRQFMVRRCKAKMSRHRGFAELRLADAIQNSKGRTECNIKLPDIELVEGRNGPGWILARNPNATEAHDPDLGQDLSYTWCPINEASQQSLD